MLERWAVYTSPKLTLASGASIIGQGIWINAQPADFYLRGIAMQQALGQFRVKIRRPDGSYMQSDYVNSNNIQPIDKPPVPIPIFPPQRYPFGSNLAFDILNPSTPAPNNSTYLVFYGSHRFLDVPAAPAPPLEGSPYELCLTVSLSGNDRTSFPLRLPFKNLAFAIRTLDYSYGIGNDPLLGDVLIQLRDENGRSFMNDYTNLMLLAQGDETAFPGLVSPAAVIPPDGAFRLDIRETAGTAYDLQIKFGGVLLNAV